MTNNFVESAVRCDCITCMKDIVVQKCERRRAEMTYQLYTVCAACLRVSCWHGVKYCDGYDKAGTYDLPFDVLMRMNLEDKSYWKDGYDHDELQDEVWEDADIVDKDENEGEGILVEIFMTNGNSYEERFDSFEAADFAAGKFATNGYRRVDDENDVTEYFPLNAIDFVAVDGIKEESDG